MCGEATSTSALLDAASNELLKRLGRLPESTPLSELDPAAHPWILHADAEAERVEEALDDAAEEEPPPR